MRRKIRNEGMYVTPQRVYGIVEGACCRECRFCLANGNETIRARYCIRFFKHEDPRGLVHAYDLACGKFEGKETP